MGHTSMQGAQGGYKANPEGWPTSDKTRGMAHGYNPSDHSTLLPQEHIHG
ncbi:hypothetical protein [Acidithiobacillus ferriphilus]|nr:hypothetical protein [Acidithiobacillus ferriphilus]WCE92910.1 hypothetical protein PJU76_08025 [Acidithiobacillus ferriphilus]